MFEFSDQIYQSEIQIPLYYLLELTSIKRNLKIYNIKINFSNLINCYYGTLVNDKNQLVFDHNPPIFKILNIHHNTLVTSLGH